MNIYDGNTEWNGDDARWEKKIFQASLTSNEMSAHTFLRAVKVNVPLSSGILTDFRWKRSSISGVNSRGDDGNGN